MRDIKVPRTIPNIRASGNWKRRVRRFHIRKERVGLRIKAYEERPKANICVSIASRKEQRPGSGIFWPTWRIMEAARERYR